MQQQQTTKGKTLKNFAPGAKKAQELPLLKPKTSGVNKVILIGRLGQDPEFKETKNGGVLNFSIATSEAWVDKKTGELQERVEWHRVAVWGKLAEVCAKYLEKGKQVYVDGKLQTNSYETEQGETRYSTQIIANSVQFLGSNTQTENN